MVQQPLLPKWLPAALAALLAALIALVALWFTLFKPTIQSSAREAAAQQVEEVANTANEAKDTADKAAEQLGIPTEPGTPPGPDGATTTTPSPTPAPVPPPEPIDFRITTGVDPSGNPATGPTVFTTFLDNLPAEVIVGKTLAVSDLVLQNPFGDSGILRVLRVTGEGDERQETVLLEVGLNNFRDLDYHFLQPLRFEPGERIAVAVHCQNPAVTDESDTCDPSASFSGLVEGAAPEPAPTSPAPVTSAPTGPAPTNPAPAEPVPTSSAPAGADSGN